MAIGVRELKASLSRVLSRAQGGEIIEVTCHNKPIARIVGILRQAEAGEELYCARFDTRLQKSASALGMPPPAWLPRLYRLGPSWGLETVGKRIEPSGLGVRLQNSRRKRGLTPFFLRGEIVVCAPFS